MTTAAAMLARTQLFFALGLTLFLGACGVSRLSDSEIDRACELANRCTSAPAAVCTRDLIDARERSDANGCDDLFARTNRCYLSADSCTVTARCQQLSDDLTACAIAATRRDAGPAMPDAAACTQTMCGDLCVDTTSSTNHCGGCDRPCELGSCSSGVCVAPELGDVCASAAPFTAPPGDMFGFRWSGARDDRSSCSIGHDSDYVFRWTARETNLATVIALGPTDETLVAATVYAAADCSAASEVVCAEDVGGVSLSFDAVAGTEYFLVLASTRGSGMLTVF